MILTRCRVQLSEILTHPYLTRQLLGYDDNQGYPFTTKHGVYNTCAQKLIYFLLNQQGVFGIEPVLALTYWNCLIQ